MLLCTVEIFCVLANPRPSRRRRRSPLPPSSRPYARQLHFLVSDDAAAAACLSPPLGPRRGKGGDSNQEEKRPSVRKRRDFHHHAMPPCCCCCWRRRRAVVAAVKKKEIAPLLLCLSDPFSRSNCKHVHASNMVGEEENASRKKPGGKEIKKRSPSYLNLKRIAAIGQREGEGEEKWGNGRFAHVRSLPCGIPEAEGEERRMRKVTWM